MLAQAKHAEEQNNYVSYFWFFINH